METSRPTLQELFDLRGYIVLRGIEAHAVGDVLRCWTGLTEKTEGQPCVVTAETDHADYLAQFALTGGLTFEVPLYHYYRVVAE